MKIISTNEAPEAIGPYSQALRLGNMVYTSGQIALTPEGEMLAGDIKEQTRQVLTNLRNVLVASGSDMSGVIKTTVYLSNIDDFLYVNTIYAEFFGSHKPARSTVEVSRLPKDALVEIEAIATLTSKQGYSY